jgi:hypothetical protein
VVVFLGVFTRSSVKKTPNGLAIVEPLIWA